MAKILFTSTHGTGDPNRASMPFHFAKSAREEGYDDAVVLANDGPLILRDSIARPLLHTANVPLTQGGHVH